MRVLHITDRLSGRGGADCHLLGVIAHQAREHHVEMAVSHVDGTATEPCPVHRVEGLGARGRSPASLDELVVRVCPDVVHVHNVVNPEVLDWAAENDAVMTVQDHRCFCPGRGKLTASGRVCRERFSADGCAACFSDGAYHHEMLELTEARRQALLRMRRVTVLSTYMKRELVAVGLESRRISVIPPFVHEPDLDAEPDGPTCVLFVGRVVAAKGVRDAVAAWRRSGVDLPFVVAGTGSERATVEAEGAQVLGWLSRPELARLYRRAAVVLVPSLWQEPFGIVGLESLRFGVPVLAYDSGGVRDWHSGPGLVPWGDVEALAAGLPTAVGTRATLPPGFTPGPLMDRLASVYRSD